MNQLDSGGNVRSRTFYDENGRPFTRQDFDHTHGKIQGPYEQHRRFDASGKPITPKTINPLPPGYDNLPTRQAMSTFICGLFEAKNANDIEDLHRLGWMIADEGRRERLYFHLYSAISQQIVFQIVGFSFEKAPLNHLPFLISNSPIWNVSDELLEDQAATITTLTKLHRIFSKLAGHITRIEIYFSEGWDERYERIEVTLDNFEATVLARLAEDPEVPSICVDVRL